MSYGKDTYQHVLSLEITGNDLAQYMTTSFWSALDFDNLTGLEKLVMRRCPPLLLDGLQKLSSTINFLEISDQNMFTGKELTQMFSCMPKLSELKILGCTKITGLGVVGQLKEATSSSREEEGIAAEGLLLLPSQLQKLNILCCSEISLRPDSLHGDCGGLQGLTSMHSLSIGGCRKFLAHYLPSPFSCFPFPTTLQSLHLHGVEMLAPLSNLASLMELWIEECGDLGGVDLVRLLAHGCLHDLLVKETPNFFHIQCSWDTPVILEQDSKQLSLTTDDVARILTTPICRLFSSSLTSLTIEQGEMEHLTEEQDQALHLLTSLQRLDLSPCTELQRIPLGLQNLTNLETLVIPGSPAIHFLRNVTFPNSLQVLQIYQGDIRSLHNVTFPNSLRKLRISCCSSIRSLPKDGLPTSLQELEISWCQSIQALPKGSLPSSLQILDVRNGNSDNLRRQCRKLIGTIPIVYA
ncbi:unnamed protein product [Urochloa humidicola]